MGAPRAVKEAIKREQAGGRSWTKARDLYIKGVGYTLVNRLAALRCMEVRGFVDRSPTRFRADGVTPAADVMIDEYFLPREAGIWTAFLVACRKRSEEIELLFDLSDPYSMLYGDLAEWDGEPDELAWTGELQASLVELLQDLGALLDEVDDAVWRADDVLGWVYEYYNVPDLDAVRKKARERTGSRGCARRQPVLHAALGGADADGQQPRQAVSGARGHTAADDPEPGRALHAGGAQDPRRERGRVHRRAMHVSCSHRGGRVRRQISSIPSEIRVFDPAVGSAHFLLYSFDVLERIWWAMAPEVPRSEVPAKILRHNFFGVDLDLRACQLAAFNLYLKARSRAEEHGAQTLRCRRRDCLCGRTCSRS